MFKDSDNQAEFELLMRATRHELFHFIIVQYQHLTLVSTVKNDLKAKYPERPFAEFNLENINPETFIRSILDCKTGFVFIEKFELLFQKDFQALAIGFNQRRDLFSTLPIQLIVFIPSGGNTLQLFQQTIPDFYSILNLSINLKTEILPEAGLQEERFFENTNNSFDNIDEARKEIKRIEKRLQTLENTPENIVLKRELISQLANAYRFCADYLKSKDLLELLLAELEQQNDTDLDTEIATIQNSLATVLQDLGEYEKAKILLQKALISDEKNFGEEHPTTAVSYSNLAMGLRYIGDYSAAKELLAKVLILHEKIFGELHATTAITYSNLALVLKDLGEYDQAKILLIKALSVDEKNFGNSHPTTAISYSNLATVLQALGEYEQSITLLEKAYSIFYNHLGEQHPYTQRAKDNLDYVIQKSKNQS